MGDKSLLIRLFVTLSDYSHVITVSVARIFTRIH